MSFGIADLDAIVRGRLGADAGASYTASLARKGVDKCAEKFGEEAVEAVVAAVKREPAALVHEAADVIYHLTVLLAVSGVTWDEVATELKRRTAQSGHEEKASRPRD